MKNNSTLLVTVLLMTTMIWSCKKGYQDPLFSLSSRKARLSGDWVVSSYDCKTKTITTPSVGDVSTAEFREQINGEEMSMENTTTTGNRINIINESGDAKYNISFTDDGTFEMVKEYTLKSTFEQAESSSKVVMDVIHTTKIGENIKRTRLVNIKQKGTWNFLAGVEEDFKSEQRIVLNILSQSTHEVVTDNKKVVTTKVMQDIEADTSYTNTTIGEPFTTNTTNDNEVTYKNGENSQIWDLTKLSCEEVLATVDTDNKQVSSSSFTSSQDGSNSFQGSTVKTTGTCSIVLKRKN